MQGGNRFKDNTPHSNDDRYQDGADTKIKKFPTDQLQDQRFSSSNNIYETKDNCIDSANFNSDESHQILESIDIPDNRAQQSKHFQTSETRTLYPLLSDV